MNVYLHSADAADGRNRRPPKTHSVQIQKREFRNKEPQNRETLNALKMNRNSLSRKLLNAKIQIREIHKR